MYLSSGDGRGGMKDSGLVSVAGCPVQGQLRVGDWNGDARDDLVVTTVGLQQEISLMLLVGDDSAGLRRLTSFAGGLATLNSTAAVAADLDGSRRTHLALISGGRVFLYRNQVRQ